MDLTPRQILDALVAFPTVSRDSNLDLVAWIERYLAAHGIASTRVMNPEATKASLYAQIGPDVAGGVVLSGHTDVVPVDGQAWSTDPWVVTERGGRLYGRGTCDMKGFDALALWAMGQAAREARMGRPLVRPLQLALSYDEELGCAGCVGMVAEMAAVLPRAAAVVVGEPSRMKAVTGHKGGVAFATHVKGFEVHSSIMHTGVNAIMEGARLIEWANATNAANRARATAAPVAAPGSGMGSASAGPDGSGAAEIPGTGENRRAARSTAPAMAALFDPPWTTVHIGQIAGGTAHNITAADCRFGLDFRVVPGEAMEDWVAAYLAEVACVEAGMKAVRPDTGIALTRAFTVPPLVPEPGGAAEALVRRLTGDNAGHVVSYGTEAGHFQAAGYSAVVCGPGDIAQAHQPDEYLEVAEFDAGHIFMERLLASLRA